MFGIFFSQNGWALEVRVQQTAGLNLVQLVGEVFRSDHPKLDVLQSPQIDPDLDTIFILESPGGVVSDGSYIISRLDSFQKVQAARGRSTLVYVGPERRCASLCTAIFMSFRNRFSARNAHFGFHGASVGKVYSEKGSQDLLNLYGDAVRNTNNEALRQWLATRIQLFSSPQTIWFSGQKLAREGLMSGPSLRLRDRLQKLVEQAETVTF